MATAAWLGCWQPSLMSGTAFPSPALDPHGAARAAGRKGMWFPAAKAWFTHRALRGRSLPGPTRWRDEAFTPAAVPETKVGPVRHGSSLSPAGHGRTRVLICAV